MQWVWLDIVNTAVDIVGRGGRVGYDGGTVRTRV